MKTVTILFASLAFTLSACQQEASISQPEPVAITANAVGHYCQMTVTEHEGPKAQIHLAKSAQPIWFTQVRDAIAFTRLPEETDEVLAIYVSDMGEAVSWRNPGSGNWIDAHKAYYVLESKKQGGMGAPEAIPFGTAASATDFSKKHGGNVVRYSEIPDQYILAPVDVDATSSISDNQHHGTHQ